MTTESPEKPAEEVIDLKDPALAALLAWLVPGLGHWYQGRKAKAVLYFVAIVGIFEFGVFLGGGSYVDAEGREQKLGYGRAAYFSLRDGDVQLLRLSQIGIGLPALPALVQANRMRNHQKVWWGGFMAPPRLPSAGGGGVDPNLDQPTPQDLHRRLNRYFELATFFAMVGGLLNVLAIYDAAAGPVPIQPPAKKEEKEEKGEEKPEEATA
jgi:hypothetical protein